MRTRKIKKGNIVRNKRWKWPEYRVIRVDGDFLFLREKKLTGSTGIFNIPFKAIMSNFERVPKE